MAQSAQRATGAEPGSHETSGPTFEWVPANLLVRGVETGALPAMGAVVTLWQVWRAMRRGDLNRAIGRGLLAVLFTAMAVLPWWPEPSSDAGRVARGE
ncbi:hypothetical protein ACKVMT_16675 [Halobacteriales archaeon Cl-PHB]